MINAFFMKRDSPSFEKRYQVYSFKALIIAMIIRPMTFFVAVQAAGRITSSTRGTGGVRGLVCLVVCIIATHHEQLGRHLYLINIRNIFLPTSAREVNAGKLSIYIHTRIYIYTHTHVYIYTHTHTYIYIHTRIYIYTHTHVYIYICVGCL